MCAPSVVSPGVQLITTCKQEHVNERTFRRPSNFYERTVAKFWYHEESTILVKSAFFSFFQKRNSGQKFHWFRMDDSLKGWFYICLESKHNHVLTVVDRPWQVTIKENELVLCPFLIKQSLAQGSNYVPWRMARINCGPGIEVSWSTSCPVVVGVSGDLPSLRFQRMSYAQLPHSLSQVMSVKRVPNAKDQTLVQDRRKSRESAHAQLWRWEEDGSLVLADYPAYCLVSK